MQSANKYRPRTLDEVVGQDKVVKRLRGLAKKRKFPHAIMFTGKKGSGKTTIARILAITIQCSHQKVFGHPCKECRQKVSKYPIFELDNSGEQRGVKEVKEFIDRAGYEVIGIGRKKVFIFDEAHNLSALAQDSLLKSFEDKANCLWIICTTRPSKITDTLRSRCRQFALRPFDRDDTVKLVSRILKRENSELSIDDLVDELVENKVDSGRLICGAIDNYIAGDSAADAAQVEGITEINSKALIRATIKGDWPSIALFLQKTNEADIRLLRASVINYLRTILLESSEFNDRTKSLAEAIKRLAYVTRAEDSVQLAALSAELYTLSDLFRDNSF